MGKLFGFFFAVVLLCMTLTTACGPLPPAESSVSAVASAPAGLTITQTTSGTVTLTWMPSGGDVESYTVYRNGTVIGTTSNSTSTSGELTLAATTFIDTGLTPVTTYYYSISSTSSKGVESAKTTPLAATTLREGAVSSGPPVATVAQTTTNSVTISWTPAGGGLVSYRIYRNGIYIGSTTATSYLDTNLSPGTTYSYTISVSTESAQSTQVVATTQQGTAPQTVVKAVSTLAGTATTRGGSIDSTGAAASFSGPYGITSYGGYLYVSDSNSNIIRKIEIATGNVTTVAGAPGVAGTTDGVGGTARFSTPRGIATDGVNLYVADSYNNTIRQINIATSMVTTIAGSAGLRGFVNGTGSVARFNSPRGVAISGGNLYVADAYNHLIRKISLSTRQVTTLAGVSGVHGQHDGIGTGATFYLPYGVACYGGKLYVADTCNHLIRVVDLSTTEVTTLAGTARTSGTFDGIGLSATFHYPDGIATDGTSLFIADTSNHDIRRVGIDTAEVVTIAGVPGSSGSTDSSGPLSKFFGPHGVVLVGGELFVTDSNNNTVRRVTLDLL